MHDRERFTDLSPDDRGEIEHRHRQHVAEQEEQGIERLALRGSRDFPLDCEMREESFQVRCIDPRGVVDPGERQEP